MVDRSVVAAVERDLVLISRGDEELAGSALAMSCLALAVELDNPSNSATSKSMCAKTLLETLERLRSLAPEKEGMDRLDELAARRTDRLSAATG